MRKAEREGDGRSMGGIREIPPVPQGLCRKAFPAITGGEEEFFAKLSKISSSLHEIRICQSMDWMLVLNSYNKVVGRKRHREVPRPS